MLGGFVCLFSKDKTPVLPRDLVNPFFAYFLNPPISYAFLAKKNIQKQFSFCFWMLLLIFTFLGLSLT